MPLRINHWCEHIVIVQQLLHHICEVSALDLPYDNHPLQPCTPFKTASSPDNIPISFLHSLCLYTTCSHQLLTQHSQLLHQNFLTIIFDTNFRPYPQLVPQHNQKKIRTCQTTRPSSLFFITGTIEPPCFWNLTATPLITQQTYCNLTFRALHISIVQYKCTSTTLQSSPHFDHSAISPSIFQSLLFNTCFIYHPTSKQHTANISTPNPWIQTLTPQHIQIRQ